MINFKDFSWGVVTGFFSVVIMLSSLLLLFRWMGYSLAESSKLSVFSLSIGLIFILIALAIYIIAGFKGKIHRNQRLENLLLELNSVKKAKEDAEGEYFRRGMDRDSRNKILQDLKRRELTLKSQIEILNSKK